MLLECKDCSALVDASVIATHLVPGDPDDTLGWPELWTFAACPRCKRPMLAIQVDSGDGFADDTPFRRYPPPDQRLGWSVPKQIRKAFSEAVTCYKAKAYTACAIMCRKSLEGMCADHGVREKTLALSLKKLKDTGVIELRLFEWAEALRQLGNEAAHDVATQTTPDDAKDILEFTEALAEYIFTYRDKFKQFKERRSLERKTRDG